MQALNTAEPGQGLLRPEGERRPGRFSAHLLLPCDKAFTGSLGFGSVSPVCCCWNKRDIIFFVHIQSQLASPQSTQPQGLKFELLSPAGHENANWPGREKFVLMIILWIMSAAALAISCVMAESLAMHNTIWLYLAVLPMAPSLMGTISSSVFFCHHCGLHSHLSSRLSSPCSPRADFKVLCSCLGAAWYSCALAHLPCPFGCIWNFRGTSNTLTVVVKLRMCPNSATCAFVWSSCYFI